MGRKELYKYLGIDAAGVFSGSQVCKILDIKRSTFHTWNKKYFEPSGSAAEGPFRAAEWTIGDVVSIKAFLTLIKSDIPHLMAYAAASRIGPYVDKSDNLKDETFCWVVVFPDGTGLGNSRIVWAAAELAEIEYIDHKMMIGVNVLAALAKVKEGIKNLKK